MMIQACNTSTQEVEANGLGVCSLNKALPQIKTIKETQSGPLISLWRSHYLHVSLGVTSLPRISLGVLVSITASGKQPLVGKIEALYF